MLQAIKQAEDQVKTELFYQHSALPQNDDYTSVEGEQLSLHFKNKLVAQTVKNLQATWETKV